MQRKPLIFKLNVAKKKPENIRKKENKCPFCNREELTDIMGQKGDMIWLMNKYRTLEDTTQTIIIESKKHLGDQSNYTVKENREIIQFVLECWKKMEESQKYRSVLLYKNFGPKSGGSLRHPHFQIVGLNEVDGYEEISSENFNGLVLLKNQEVEVNISKQPIAGFIEFNIKISQNTKDAQIQLADQIQNVVRYILSDNYYNGLYGSYNLFFYHNDDEIICKICPRNLVSPYFIGYKLSQVNFDESLETIKQGFLEYIQVKDNDND